MRKQPLVVVFGIILAVMVALLWWRVLELEQTVNTLRVLPVASTVVGLPQQKSGDNADRKQVFKLIDSAPPTNQGTSKVGVPWDVERAMIGGANENAAPTRGETTTRGNATWQNAPVQPTPKLAPVLPDSK